VSFQWSVIHVGLHTCENGLKQWLWTFKISWSSGFVLGLPPRGGSWKLSKQPWNMIHLMPCKNPCRLHIHLAFTYSLRWSLKHSVKRTWPSPAFSTNESAGSLMVTGSQSHVWSDPYCILVAHSDSPKPKACNQFRHFFAFLKPLPSFFTMPLCNICNSSCQPKPSSRHWQLSNSRATYTCHNFTLLFHFISFYFPFQIFSSVREISDEARIREHIEHGRQTCILSSQRGFETGFL